MPASVVADAESPAVESGPFAFVAVSCLADSSWVLADFVRVLASVQLVADSWCFAGSFRWTGVSEKVPATWTGSSDHILPVKLVSK